MSQLKYNILNDQLEVSDIIEDSSISTPMKLNISGVLTVKLQIIEEVRNSKKIVLTKDGNLYTRFVEEIV